MSTKTTIKILFYTFGNTEFKILSNNNDILDIPSLNLDNLDHTKTIAGVSHLLKKIHNQYSNIAFEWAKYKFVDIDMYQSIDNNQLCVDIYYCVFLPSETLIQTGYWMKMSDWIYHFPILRKMTYYV